MQWNISAIAFSVSKSYCNFGSILKDKNFILLFSIVFILNYIQYIWGHNNLFSVLDL